MLNRLLIASTIATLGATAVAQEPFTPRGGGASSAALTNVTANVRSHAAALQLASIKFEIANVLADIRFGETTAGVDDPDVRAALKRHGEIEALKVMAVRLEEFIKQFDGTAEAEAARALLARIYVQIEDPAKAAKVLQEFDASRADSAQILAVALTAAPFAKLESRVDDMLAASVDKADVVSDKFDAVFVAIRLDRTDVAAKLLGQIKTDAKTIEDKAEVLLCEAELVSRIHGDLAAADVRGGRVSDAFAINPLTRALLTWSKVDPAQKQDFGVAEASAARRKLLSSDLMRTVALDASVGARSLEAMARDANVPIPLPLARLGLSHMVPVTKARPIQKLDDGAVKETGADAATDLQNVLEAGVPIADVMTVGLLHAACTYYPGTKAARIAAAKLASYQLRVGDKPLPFIADTIDGDVVDLDAMLGKVVLVEFWSVSNEESLVGLARLAKLHGAYRHDGFEVVSVSLDGKDEMMAAMAALNAAGCDQWKSVFEGKGVKSVIARSWGIDTVPARVLIGHDGNILASDPDVLTLETLEKLVVAALRTDPDEESTDRTSEPTDWTFGKTTARRPNTGITTEGGYDLAATQLKAMPPFIPASKTTAVPAPKQVKTVGPFKDATSDVLVIGPAPKLNCSIVIVDGQDPLTYRLTCTALVPSEGYQLVADFSKTDGPVHGVFLSLIAPSAKQLVATVFQEISVDVKLTAKFETLAVYLREFQTDASYLVPPRYDFVKSLPLPTDARRSYIGPPIRTELVVSRDGTRSLELQVQTPEPGYKFEVIAVEPTDQVTRVKLRLTAPLPNDAAARSTTEYAKVTLGKAVTARIEVLVSTTRAGTATKVDEFGLVDVVKVR